MQTPSTQAFQTTPPSIMSTSSSSLATGDGTLAGSLANQQVGLEQINLTMMPVEILALLVDKTGNSIRTYHMLSFTCQEFRDLYQDKYKAQQRQAHILMYNLLTPALREKLYTRLFPKHIDMSRISKSEKIEIPLPETTDQGISSFQASLPTRSYKLIYKTYITAWQLLLQAEVRKDAQLTSELMKLILASSNYIRNTIAYTAKLFEKDFAWDYATNSHTSGFSWKIFTELASVDLEYCLQLVNQHFFIKKGKPGCQFIIRQLPGTSEKWQHLIGCLEKREIKNFLRYAVEYFCANPQLEEAQELIQLLLAQSFDVEHTDKKCEAALIMVLNFISQHKYVPNLRLSKLIVFLIEKGAPCNTRDKQGNTPFLTLIKTCPNNDDTGPFFELISCLLRQPDIDTRGALAQACNSNNLPLVQILLQYPKINVNEKTQRGESPLFIACGSGNLPIVQALLPHPEIDTKGALSEACRSGNVPLVQVLLQHPKIDTDGALYQACRSGNLPLVQILLQHPEIDTEGALSETCRSGNLPLVQTLLQHPEIDTKGALYQACVLGNLDIVQALLQFPQINVNETTQRGENPLFIACGSGNLPIVEALLRHPEIDVNTRLWYDTALNQAVYSDNLAVVQALLQHPDININIRSQWCKSALECAIGINNLPIIEILFLHPRLDLAIRLSAFNDTIVEKKDEITQTLLRTMEAQKKSTFINQALAQALEKSQLNLADILISKYGADRRTLRAEAIETLASHPN